MTAATITIIAGPISVNQHAIDRAVERFGVKKAEAEAWITDNLRKATFISKITSDTGRTQRLFAYKRAAFVLDETSNYVITLYSQNYADTALQRKIQAVLKRELAKYERKEAAMERTVIVEKAKLAVEAAECRLKMVITPSKAVVRANNERLTQIDAMLSELDRKLLEVKREKTSIAKSVVMYV